MQLLHYRHPDPLPEPYIRDLNHVGFNHLCFAVDDIEAEVTRLKASGVKFRNEMLDYHERRIVFFEGPEGITLELAQWDYPARPAGNAGRRSKGVALCISACQ